ncbi:DUF7668 domain-containing protein [Catenulispora rubra]|uniref:DUF7668 domain-containing protein n=1 Tax=Catenulispora rubra TaxID=280293 RepID=UPI0018922ABF|nr:hypothetical protein [Catenulispora rubra]
MRDDDEPVPERFRPVLEQIAERIAAGDYDCLTRDFSPYADAPVHDLGVWARDYPATFVAFPPEAWQYAHVFHDRERGEWMIDIELWSVEEGRSDMMLETVIREHDGQVQVEIRDLRVP